MFEDNDFSNGNESFLVVTIYFSSGPSCKTAEVRRHSRLEISVCHFLQNTASVSKALSAMRRNLIESPNDFKESALISSSSELFLFDCNPNMDGVSIALEKA
uniref:Uncharacterized protein n=1 Tax=Romanomermis culicivorax TaxID=13658 RepID=A0A915JA32_ROMCU